MNDGDISKLPCADIFEIDRLWRKFSNQQFGFSIQYQIWQDLGGYPEQIYCSDKTLEQYTTQVGWCIKDEQNYLLKNQIKYDNDAPLGHLPFWFYCWSGGLSGCSIVFSRIGICLAETSNNLKMTKTMNNRKNHGEREINIGNGNYNERIEGDYIQGNVYYANSDEKQVFPKICKSKRYLTEFLENSTKNLKQQFGFIEFRKNIIEDNQAIKLLARKANFDMSIGIIQMRGEAFFIFSEFEQMNFSSLKAYSAQCLNYAKTKTSSSTTGSAFYNFRFPNNLCFAIAIVDELEEEVRKDVQQINPLRDKVDALWYEIPIVYELNNKQLHFYKKPLDWKDKFTGEIAWKEIREIIQQALTP